MENAFWGYVGADVLAAVVISLASITCLASAWLFIKNYGE